MNDNKWKYISGAIVLSVLIICSMLAFINRNPFTISFQSDENFVDVSENFMSMSEAMANAEAELVRCETKLDLYNKSHGDYWSE